MKKKMTAGFTLVELIVVIAILGILAGVGTVGYSGYIKKANQAADEQLLSFLNQAFAAACIEGGDQRPSSASATLTDGTATKTSVTSTVDESGELFDKYFAGNEYSVFKYYSNLVYNRATGSFKGATVSATEENGVMTYSYNIDGVTYTVTEEQLEAIRSSTYGDKMTMDQLMGDVTGMVDAMNSALGGGTMLAGFLTSDGSTLADWGVKAEAGTDEYKTQLSNAAVLYVAKNMTADTTDTIVTALEAGNINSLMADQDNLLVNMAGLYGIATGFAHSDAADDWSYEYEGVTYDAAEYYDYVNGKIAAAAESESPNKLYDILGALNLMTAYVYSDINNPSAGMTDEFASYAQGDSSQLGKDADGLANAMTAINTNSDSLITSGAIEEGFDSSNIGGILNMIFGGGFDNN